eukprot:5631705-Karenia_brevis.AAC.1
MNPSNLTIKAIDTTTFFTEIIDFRLRHAATVSLQTATMAPWTVFAESALNMAIPNTTIIVFLSQCA